MSTSPTEIAQNINRGLLLMRDKQPELYALLVHPANIQFIQNEVAKRIDHLRLRLGTEDFVQVSIEVLEKWLHMPENDLNTIAESLSRINESWVNEFVLRVRGNVGPTAVYNKMFVQQHGVALPSEAPRQEFTRSPRKQLEYTPGFTTTHGAM
jgi:hypothetical protein